MRLGFSQLMFALLAMALLMAAKSVCLAQAAPQVFDNTQTAAAAHQKDIADIDQLIVECRALMSKGNFDALGQKAEEALVLSKKIGDKVKQSRALTYVALAAYHAGRIDEAIEPFKQAALLAGEAGDRKLQVTALRSAGVLLVDSGRHEEALYFYNQALALQRELNNRPGEASLLRNIGRIYVATRDYTRADKMLQSSLETSRSLHDKLLEYSALSVLLNMETDRGNFDLALKYAEQALGIESPEIDPAMKNELLYEVAIAHFSLGNLEKSAQVLKQVLEFARKQKVASAEGVMLGTLSQVQLRLGKTSESLVSSSQALVLLRRSGGDPAQEARVLYTQALAQRSLGRPEEALSNLRKAIALLERARLLSVATETSRAEFFSGKSDIFLGAIDLLVSLGKQDEAFSISEAYHGRAFLDLLAESRADLRKALPGEMLEKEDKILNHISAVQKELWQEGINQERERQLRKDLVEAEDALEQFQLEVRHSNPQYASLKHLQPLTVEDIQRDLVDPNTGLLEYIVGEEKSFAWLVSKDHVSYAELPPQKELNNLVVDYRKSLSERTSALTALKSVAGIKLKSRQLYEILLHPFEKQLTSFRKLIIVPDNSLAYLPFETLIADSGSSKPNIGSNTQYLLERFAISYAPSASALAEVSLMRPDGRSKGLAAFGDPVYSDEGANHERSSPLESEADKVSDYAERGLDLRRLPYTRTEVMNISALFPPADRKVFLGVDANERKVKTEKLDEFRYIHFAAHGLVDEENSARSGVILSLEGMNDQDGILQVSEIMRLKLNADLVTLSACRTGLGKVVRGEGVLGLTRAFLYAGAHSVVASLWNVNDIATAELMKIFYQNLKRGVAKDESLRRAKLRLLNGKQRAWQNPYFWAPFVLVGSSR